jgi:hypothetical protein
MELSDLRNCYASLTLRERQVIALVTDGRRTGYQRNHRQGTPQACHAQDEGEFTSRPREDGVGTRARAQSDSRGVKPANRLRTLEILK